MTGKSISRRKFITLGCGVLCTAALGTACGSQQTSSSDGSAETTARQQTQCPKGLVNDPYPGRCRQYVDSTGSGYCDLSEMA
jgi:hypothetical protein